MPLYFQYFTISLRENSKFNLFKSNVIVLKFQFVQKVNCLILKCKYLTSRSQTNTMSFVAKFFHCKFLSIISLLCRASSFYKSFNCLG